MTATTPPGWVLVVDDDPTDRLLTFRLLERIGHHATVADNGGAALDLLRAEPFDLVLLDLLMPDLDGYGVLEAMKADGRLRHVPVIVISGLDGLGDVVRAVELGADDYLDKPVDPVLLRARVEAGLTRVRLRRQEAEYLDVVGHVAQAVAAATAATFEPATLEPLSRRTDPLGQLARAVRDMALHVTELRDTIDHTVRAGPRARP